MYYEKAKNEYYMYDTIFVLYKRTATVLNVKNRLFQA